MKHGTSIGLILALMATSAVAQAPPAESLIAADKLFFMLDKFYATPPADRSKLAVHYTIMQNKKPAPNIRLTLVANGKRTPLPVAPDGEVQRLPTAEELAAHPQIAVGGGAVQVTLGLWSSIRPSEEISAADCALAIAQANSTMKRAAGVMAMLAPQVKVTTFPGAGSGVAVMADGKTTPLPLFKGAPAYDPVAIKGAKTIRLAKAPTAVGLE
jgi:hypothetical protein